MAAIKAAAATTPLPYPPPGYTEVKDAAAETPGLPPASLQSLVAARRLAPLPAALANGSIADQVRRRNIL